MSELFLEIFPEGASSEQLDKLHSEVFDRFGNPYTDRSVVWSDEIKKVMCLRDALNMLHSLYVYSEMWLWDKNRYADSLADYVALGGTKDDFDKVIELGLNHLKTGTKIVKNVHTDSEGVCYNSTIENNPVAHWEKLYSAS